MAVSKSKSKIMRDHEIKMKVLDVMANDPTAKYFIAASLGLGATWAASIFDDIGKEDKPTQSTTDKTINFYETILGVGSPLLSAAGFFDFNKDGEGGFAGNIFTFATGSYTAFCMTCCILSSASGGKAGSPLGPLAAVL